MWEIINILILESSSVRRINNSDLDFNMGGGLAHERLICNVIPLNLRFVTICGRTLVNRSWIRILPLGLCIFRLITRSLRKNLPAKPEKL